MIELSNSHKGAGGHHARGAAAIDVRGRWKALMLDFKQDRVGRAALNFTVARFTILQGPHTFLCQCDKAQILGELFARNITVVRGNGGEIFNECGRKNLFTTCLPQSFGLFDLPV